ncbi:MAG: glycosyltransferase family 39 protein [Pseudomonadota bacterium]
MKYFSIIIPTLNEADNIAPLLLQIAAVTRPLGLSPEIIFVDDGSTDATRQCIDAYSGDLDVRLVRRDSQTGLAGAVVAGARAASHPHVVVMDADLSHPPQMIPALLEPLTAGRHDMVIGSRYLGDGGTPGWPLVRRLGSQLASLPARLLTSIRDPLSGFFATSRDRLRTLPDNMPGFKIGLELLSDIAEPLRVLEIPITFRDRRSGNSKMNFSIFKEYLQQLYRLFSKRSMVRNLPLFLFLGCVAVLLDSTFFSFLNGRGIPLESSHMVSFLLAMHACYPIAGMFAGKTPEVRPSGGYRYFLLVVILGLFLRGGQLADSVANSESSALYPFVIGATSYLTWLAAIIAGRLGAGRARGVNWTVFGSLLIGYTILLRLAYLGNFDLIQEEAYYWNYAQHLATGYLDHPPVVALFIKFGTLLFGQDELGVRFGAFICWFVTAFFTYRLTKIIFNQDSAMRALVLVATLPFFFGVAVVMTPDAPLVACWAGALYFLYRALVLGTSRAWFGAGICLGIGLASKYTIAFLCPAVLLFMLIDPTARKWFLRPEPYLCALLAGVIFAPVIWWNYQHHWASFLFQSQGRLQAGAKFSTHILLLSILILLTPIGLFAAVLGMRPQRHGLSEISVLNRRHRGYIFCLTTTLVPLSIFVLFSFTKEIKLNWTGPLWLALLPFMASAMVAGSTRLQQRLSRVWPGTLVALVLIYGTLFHYFALGLPGVSFGRSAFLFGWDDLAQKVEDQVKTIAAEDGRHPLVVGMDPYRTASGLAYYRAKLHQDDQQSQPRNDTTGYHLFGHKDLMYSYWFPPKWAFGRDILVISEDKSRMDPAYFGNSYQHLGEIHEIEVEKRGKESGLFYSRLLTGYAPDNNLNLAKYDNSDEGNSNEMLP